MSTEAITPDSERPGSGVVSHVNWMSIVLFVVLTFGVSWIIWFGLGAIGVPFGIRAAIGMFGPALAALLVRLLRREGFADAGLRVVARDEPGAWRMYIAAYVLPPVLIAAGIGVALLSGVQHWVLLDNLHQLGRVSADALRRQGQPIPFGFTPDQLAAFNLLIQTLLAFTFGLLFNMIFTFGEEFGWRGYLLPRLAPLGGVPAAMISGAIWGLWHAPLIVFNSYNYPGHPWLGILMMVVFTVTLGMVFAWLRFRSGSVWPSTLAHAAINAQAGFGIVLRSRADSLVGAPIGILGLIPMIAFAVWLAVSGKLNPGQSGAADEKQPA